MMLITTAVILSLLIAYGNAYEEYPAICKNETFTMNIASDTLLHKFIVSGTIRCINIPSGGIKFMEQGAFDGVPNLTYLNLERNFISPSDLFSFGSIPNIKALILSDQTYNSYQSSVPINYIYPELQYLNLRNTKISNIINYTENSFPKLKYLDISGNRFSSFKFVQLWNNTLTFLHLNSNQISDISLNNLKNLETLTLDNNNIRRIGYSYYNNLDLTGLKNLKHLSVANNEIDSIDRLAFKETVNLRYLNLSNNQLPSYNSNFQSFEHLSSLEILALDDNKFRTIPFTTPLNITDLSMNGNDLVNLTTNSLSMVPYLRTLSLAKNKISRIDADAFSPLRVLEELYLNDNDLSYLPRLWSKSIENLRYLDLSKNKITSLDYVFGSNYVPLNELHLDDNPLENIKMDSLAMFAKNLTIYFNFGRNPTNNCARPINNGWSKNYY
ncbi:uncharacterized protein LOC100877794 [Megachile rotundata]|uniref:uncharacterized protein LOC100877794 n=1 Tax=Megachile rotundata TaxID=143995 RepID=UPI000615325A|nr:PREDICTED: toll-like receptor 13 [Megachile rotundata]